MSKVSIVVPIFNAQQYIKRTIESVLTQNFTDFELIIVDDGSTDSSLKICREIASNDQRVIILHQENSGVSSARNLGLRRASGEWIYFLDSDDKLSERFFSCLSKYLDDKYDVIQFGSIQLENNAKLVSIRQSLSEGEVNQTNSLSGFLSTSNIGSLCVWLHLIKRKLITKEGLLFSEDMQHNEDMLFMYSVLTLSKNQLLIGESLHYQYRVPNSLSRSPMSKQKINNRLLLVDRLFDLKTKCDSGDSTLVDESNRLLKGYFGSLLAYKATLGEDISEFQSEYNCFYRKRRHLLNSFYAKAAAIDISYVVFILGMAFRLKSVFINIKKRLS